MTLREQPESFHMTSKKSLMLQMTLSMLILGGQLSTRKVQKFPLYSHDFLNESFWGGTVMYLNIQLAEYLGCNPIYLVGVDLSY